MGFGTYLVYKSPEIIANKDLTTKIGTRNLEGNRRAKVNSTLEW
jgi:hypothetical protein